MGSSEIAQLLSIVLSVLWHGVNKKCLEAHLLTSYLP